MKDKKNYLAGMVVLIVLGLSFISAYSSTGSYYTYSNPIYSNLAPGDLGGRLPDQECNAGQDFLLQLSPLGCSPAVVRADLLEEQNVPVFCPIAATKINPLIDVDVIEDIYFSGQYPKEVAGVAFYPAKAALGTDENINTPVDANVGYAVIVLKRQKNSSAIPEFLKFNMTARLRYDIKNAFGVGQANFLVPEMTDEAWERNYIYYSFWNKKGFLKTDLVEENTATVSVYAENNYKLGTVHLRAGETSRRISIPDWDCYLGINLRLNDVVNPDTTAKLRVNADGVQVRKGGKFLDNKCSVIELKKYGLFQEAEISCREDNKPTRFSLIINPEVSLTIDESKGSYQIGDKLPISDGNNVYYLGFIGGFEKLKNGELIERDDLENLYVFIYKVPVSNNAGDKLGRDKIKYVANKYEEKLEAAIRKGREPEDDGGVWVKAGGRESVGGKQVVFNGFADANNELINEDFKENYENALKDFRAILDSYANIKENEKTYGELALEEAIEISNIVEQRKKVVELCQEFEELYPKVSLPGICSKQLLLSNVGSSEISVLINGKTSVISFDGIFEPRFEDYGVVVDIDGVSYFLKKDEKVFLKSAGEKISDKEYIQLVDLDTSQAKFQINFKSSKRIDEKEKIEEYVSRAIVAEKNKIGSFGTLHNLYVREIYLNKVADVSVLPSIEYTNSEAKFAVGIGIEKRAIELSPAWTKKKINQLNKTIAKWGDRSEKLGMMVKGLKGACIGVGTSLMVKNFFSGLSGESIARKDVMNKHWKQECARRVEEGEFKYLDVCYLKNADEIDRDVALEQKKIKEYNEKMKIWQDNSDITKKNFWGEDIVDEEKLSKKFFPQVRNKLADFSGGKFVNPERPNEEPIELGKGSAVYNAFDISKMSIEEAREIDLNLGIINDNSANEGLKKASKKRLYEILSDINNREAQNHQVETLAESLNIPPSVVGVIEEKNTKTINLMGSYLPPTNKRTSDYGGVKFGENIKGIYVFQTTGGGDGRYLVTYDAQGVVQNTYKKNDGQWKVVDNENSNPNKLRFKIYSENSYHNEYKSSYASSTGPVVRYYEREPYKGLPAVVPFDLKNGWYAATRQALPVLGRIGAYDDSGRVVSFYVCNVGKNGREEFKITGDDICQQINTGTGQPYNVFPGLSPSEASKVIRCGQQAIEQASKAYRKGISGRIPIRTSCGSASVKVGKPAIDVPEIECQDIMSPKSCALLFNVCDPVICPASRCDFGGSFPVQDPVQSGIIGSLLLCLPNFKGFGGDVVIPTCLTGLKAGIDSLLSVFQSYRDCLQQNLDSGEMVGICDEVYSVHLCEFFWRQGLPLAKVAIPKMFEMLLGGASRGGGEYQTVSAAWENAKASADYFTGYYAANAWKSFAARSQDTEQVGSEVCKNFASANYGLNLDKLTDPDSPPQFHGRFDEIPFTTATNPPTSQYKVFYHIYAGKDSQVYYRVYLKGDVGSSYYQEVSGNRLVASGYIKKGDYASETLDFTAPSGYKELCINVNGQEECGFKQVSTSMAINYAKDFYMKDIASQKNIKSEKECVSGKPSIYSALNPNVQEGASEIIAPEIYKRGIIRICATENPGKGTDPKANLEGSRWVQVGDCGTPKIKCWLDTKSVKNVIYDLKVENQTLQDVQNYYLKVLDKQGKWEKQEYESFVSKLKDEGPGDKIALIDKNIENVFYNKHKANLLLIRGQAYAELAKRGKSEEEEE